jgi:hypothetical protein
MAYVKMTKYPNYTIIFEFYHSNKYEFSFSCFSVGHMQSYFKYQCNAYTCMNYFNFLKSEIVSYLKKEQLHPCAPNRPDYSPYKNK